MSDTASSNKTKIPRNIPGIKVPVHIKKFEGLHRGKLLNEVKRRLDNPQKVDQILKKNKELFDVKTLNVSFQANQRQERRSLSFKTVDKETFQEKIRNASLTRERQKDTLVKDKGNEQFLLTPSESKSKEKIVKVLNFIPKIELPLTKPLKLNLSLARNSEKDNFFKAINKINSSLETSNKNGQTIINIHNNINIKIKDNSQTHLEQLKNFSPPVKTKEKSSSTNLSEIIDKSTKHSPIKSIKDTLKNNNFLLESKELERASEKKTSSNPPAGNKHKLHAGLQIPLKLININPKVVKISSLIKPKIKTDNKSVIEPTRNENSLISFDESLISKSKKDSNPTQSIEKPSKGDEVSLSYSEDERTNKPIKINNNPEKVLNTLVQSFDANTEQSDENESEFLRFCENLEKKILNK